MNLIIGRRVNPHTCKATRMLSDDDIYAGEIKCVKCSMRKVHIIPNASVYVNLGRIIANGNIITYLGCIFCQLASISCNLHDA